MIEEADKVTPNVGPYISRPIDFRARARRADVRPADAYRRARDQARRPRPGHLPADPARRAGQTFSRCMFRTMKLEPPCFHRRYAEAAGNPIHALGLFLRKSSSMSCRSSEHHRGPDELYRPRPALPSQHDVIALPRGNERDARPPGITGLPRRWAATSSTPTPRSVTTPALPQDELYFDIKSSSMTVAAVLARGNK